MLLFAVGVHAFNLPFTLTGRGGNADSWTHDHQPSEVHKVTFTCSSAYYR